MAQETDEERKTSLEKMVHCKKRSVPCTLRFLQCSYRTAQVSHGDGRRKKSKTEEHAQLRLAPETEDERRARLEYLSDNPIYIPNNLYLILIVAF